MLLFQPYLAEIAPLRLKGIFGSFGPLGIALGCLLCAAMGMFFHWKECVIIIIVFNFIMTGALIFYMPESPSWLFANGREGEGFLKSVCSRGVKRP